MNSVILIGRITKDIELRYTTGERQTAVAQFTVAVDRMKNDEADFPRVTAFGKTAENTANYLHKGSKIGIQGRLQTGSYKDKDGKTVYTTDVIADRVEFLDTREKSEELEPEAPPIEQFSYIDEDVPF